MPPSPPTEGSPGIRAPPQGLQPKEDPRAPGVVSKLLDSLHFEPSEGVLEILGTRFFLHPTALVANLYREMEGSLGDEAPARFQRAGERTALQASRDLTALLSPGDASAAKALVLLQPLWAALGLGHFSLVDYDEEGGRVVLRTSNSPWAEAYGPGDGPVCHLTAGFVTGVFKALGYGRPVCQEDRCKAVGDPYCQFTVRYRARGEG